VDDAQAMGAESVMASQRESVGRLGAQPTARQTCRRTYNRVMSSLLPASSAGVPEMAEAAWAARLQPAFLATFMSGFVSALVTALNTGLDGGTLLRWLLAWALAWPAAVLAAYLARPAAARLSRAAARLLLRWRVPVR
jgi:hypothetical protein